MLEVFFSQTKQYHDFIPIVEGLTPDLGERFSHSIENWCGIGKRPYPLKVWEVYLATLPSAIPLGLFSYYQQEEDPLHKFWIGWIGVLPEHRRRGYGRSFVQLLERMLRERGASEIWVYTDADNEDAIALYRHCGMTAAGVFAETGLRQAAARADSVVLMKHL